MRDVKDRKELYTVDELIKDPAFRSSLINSSNKLAIRKNTLSILPVYIQLEMLQTLKRIEILLKREAGIEETEEEREVRIDREIAEENKTKTEETEEELTEEELTEEEMEEGFEETKTKTRKIKRIAKDK